MMKTEETNTRFARILAAVLVIYAYIVTYIDGHLNAIPNVHTYVLLPVAAFAAFCFLYYLRDGLKITTSSAVLMVYGFYVAIRYVLAGTQDLMTIWGCMIILMLISATVDLDEKFTYRIILFAGYFQFATMLVQILFPTFFNTHIAVLFGNSNNIISWASNNCYTGFSFQIGYTSLHLIFAEGYCLARAFDKQISTKTRLLFIAQTILLIVAIALTGKRGTLAISVIIPLIILVADKRTRKVGIIISLVGGVSAVVFAFILYRFGNVFANSGILSRLSYSIRAMLNGGDFSSGRLSLWSKAIEVFKLKPIFGTGVHSFWFYSGTGMDPHNTYLETLCEQGIVGFALFVGTIIWSLCKTVRLLNRDDNPKSFATAFVLFVILEQFFDAFLENSMLTNIIELIMYLSAVSILNSIAVSVGDSFHEIHIRWFEKLGNKSRG